MSSGSKPIGESRTELTLVETAPVWSWIRLRALVLDSVSSPHSRRVYGRALEDFHDWCGASGRDRFSKETVQQYRVHLEARKLAPSTLNLHLTVIRRLAREAADHGLLSEETALAIARVKGSRQKGTRLGA